MIIQWPRGCPLGSVAAQNWAVLMKHSNPRCIAATRIFPEEPELNLAPSRANMQHAAHGN